MNKNSKQRRAIAAKAGSATFDITQTMPGGHLGTRKQVITIGHAHRKSTRAKVGGGRP